MHNGALKAWALALTFWLALQMSAVKAQIFTAPLQASTTGTDPVDFEFRADGTLIATGKYGVGTLLSTDQGAGERLLWYPALAAFRAGGLGTPSPYCHDWDLSKVGIFSAAMGQNVTASGAFAMAFGNDTTASGTASFAIGYGSVASGVSSTAFGEATASGNWSTASGGSTASGFGSVALGQSVASGDDSTAIGQSTASGAISISFGRSTASGAYSTGFGFASTASGEFSTASGYYTSASAYDSFVIGILNLNLSSTGMTPSATAWVPTDPLFEIGNGNFGTASNNYAITRSDAFVVYKNGNVSAQGVITAAPGGDIPMYTGN